MEARPVDASPASVAVIMGSQSDWPTMEHAVDTLGTLGIAADVRIVSAHRTPDRMVEFARAAEGAGIKVIIAGAGGAAHLPGMVAALTPLPVLGVPVESKALSGQDSLLSIVQMPAGIPVGTLAIGRSGAINAALLAAAILGLTDASVAAALAEYRARHTNDVRRSADRRSSFMTLAFGPGALLAAGSTVGILGGGQLARMLAMAAARLGYRVVALDPDPAAPAGQVANELIVAPYDDPAALNALAVASDVVTYEFENVPEESAAQLSATVPVHPDPGALAVAQDRLVEKDFLTSIGVGTAAYRAVDSQADVDAAVAELGGRIVLKTRRLGYDGKGQLRIDGAVPDDAFASLGGVPLIAEALVDFAFEISVIMAAGADGATFCFEPSRNEHGDGILRSSTVPSGASAAVLDAATSAARAMAAPLRYVGVLGLELFVLDDESVVANEFAPRVHNSGHWTELACPVDQFEQHIRAITGHPLGDGMARPCEMINLIGDDVERVPELVADGRWRVHVYGKVEVRSGRKMGHATRLL